MNNKIRIVYLTGGNINNDELQYENIDPNIEQMNESDIIVDANNEYIFQDDQNPNFNQNEISGNVNAYNEYIFQDDQNPNLNQNEISGNVDQELDDNINNQLNQQSESFIESPSFIPANTVTPSLVNSEYFNISRMNLATIKENTVLYHGTFDVDMFNPFDIRLGKDVLTAYFSNNKTRAADRIMHCAMQAESNKGYLHTFRTKKPINKVLVKSITEIKGLNEKEISNQFCKSDKIKLNGLMFQIQRKKLDEYGRQTIYFDYQLAICDPDEYLEYISTQQCILPYTLSQPYRPLYSEPIDNEIINS
jgi:hypothetical protein